MAQVWRFNEKTGEWQQEGAPLGGHTDWVRDVAWMPNLGLPANTLASAGQDGKVLIWSESREQPGTWTSTLLHDFQVNPNLWRMQTLSAPCFVLHVDPCMNVIKCSAACLTLFGMACRSQCGG